MLRYALPGAFAASLIAIGLGLSAGASAQQPRPASSAPPATDLDALMERALARRDENWKKLDQYVLDESENMEVRGPGNALMFGDHREYTWFVREGFFVRSPVRANGVTIGEPDRLTYEQRWLRQERGRQAARDRERAARGAPPATPPAQTSETGDISAFLQQTREPRFISAGYFLEFDFEPGNYYLAGRELLNGRQVLRIEYYPTTLFDERRNRRAQNRDQDSNSRQEEVRRQMNKTALVTLWVEPGSAEIVKYTFDNLGLDFIPGGWLVRFTDMRATIDMLEPFPGVWLPGSVDVNVALALATGAYTLRYRLNYHGYKQAAVKATIIPRPLP